jgi:glycosyltransferase involved in cell wall biosynthesis
LKLTVIQTLPALNAGGVERGTIEIAGELVRQGHRSIVISAGGQMLDELIGTGSEHISLPIGKKSPITLLLIKKLRKIITENHVDILHARSRLPAWISYLAWNKMDQRTRPRFITSVHGPYTVNSYSKIMVRGETVIAISKFIQDYIKQNYPDTNMDKVTVIPRGISQDRFPYKYKPSQSWLQDWENQNPQLAGRYLVTLPARITRWKGQQDFIKIIAQLIQSGIDVHGIIAGGAESRRQDYLQQLKSDARSLSVDKHLTFLGHRNDLREIMSVSRLVLSLAREPEAFGRTALEALALGVPVIAYDHGGASEILTEMFPQGLVEALNQDAIVRKIIEFQDHPPQVTKDTPFTLSRMLDATINLYKKTTSL